MLKAFIAGVALLSLVGCNGFDAGRMATQAKIVTQEPLIASVKLYNVTLRQANSACPKGDPGLKAVCHDFRVFAEGKDPSAAVCVNPDVGSLQEVQEKCGFPKSMKALRDAHVAGSGMADSVASQVNSIVGQLNSLSDLLGVR